MNEMQGLIKKLHSTKADQVMNALTDIKRNYIRKVEKRSELEKYSIVQEVVSLMDHPKYCYFSISIIADACVQKYWIPQIIKKDGIKRLSGIIKSLISSKIQNQACRALGNIAKGGNFEEIQNETLIKGILEFLSNSEEITYKQTALRTLRILGTVSKSRDIIIRESGIYYIAKLLKHSDKDLLSCCTQTLAILTENCQESCFEQFIKAISLINFIDMYKDIENDSKTNIVKSLQNISYHESARPILIKSGAVKLFLRASVSYVPLDNRKTAILGLCNCLNYMHMFLNYGATRKDVLKSLVEALRIMELKEVHLDIVSALLPLTFEQENAEILIELELVTILTERLKIILKSHKIPHEILQNFDSPKMSSLQPKFSKTHDDSCNTEKETKNKKSIVSKSNQNVKDNNLNTKPSFYCTTNFLVNSQQSSRYFEKNSSICSSPYSPTSSNSNAALSPINYSDCSLEWPKSVPQLIWSSNKLCYSSEESIDSDSCRSEVFEEDNVPTEKSYLSCLEKDQPTSTYKTAIENKIIPKVLVSESNYDSSLSEKLQNNMKCKISDIKCEKKIRDSESYQCCSEETANKRFKTDFSKIIEENENQSNIENNKNLTSDSSVLKNELDIDASILTLLFRLSFHLEKKSNSVLASKSCFSVLLQYISSIQNSNSNAEKILIELVKNRYCFEKLMLNGFVFEMDTLLKTIHDVDDCKHCLYINAVRQNLMKNLSQEMESDYGVGTICHILCISEKLCKFYAIYSTSKLISSKIAFRKILKQANGLSLIFEFFNDTSDIIKPQSILCLCQIYQKLSKTRKSEIFKHCCIYQTCSLKLTATCAYKEDNLDVTFVVDNDVKICASREKLCCSDFFHALLKGYFKESEENVIKICDISAETMTTIFHFLHGCYSTEYCPYIKRIPFEVLLELIGSCERFLLGNIKMFVTDKLCHTLSPETVSKIYLTAKMFDYVDLYKKCIQYILGLDVSKLDIVLKCFQDMNFQDLHVLNDIKCEIELLLDL